jgi:hypothetical protein
MKWFTRHLLAPLIAVALLTGLYATDAKHLRPADVGTYHQRVKATVEAVPYVIGDWIGRDVPVPTQATDMLKPNALLSRQYLNTKTAERVSVLLIHTLDARDLIGHYPPECYPANGWTITGRGAVMLPVGDDDDATPEQIEVAEYQFAMDDFANRNRLQVLNLMILPTGKYSIGMAGLSGVSGDYRIRHFGAAALQMVFTDELSPQRQAEVWPIFFHAIRPALRTIQNAQALEAENPKPD